MAESTYPVHEGTQLDPDVFVHPVSGAPLPILVKAIGGGGSVPAGAATAAKQDEGNALLNSLEAKATSANTLLTSLETKSTAANTLLTSLETKAMTANALLTSLEADTTAANTLLTSLETKATTTNTLLTSLEAKVTAIQSKLDSLYALIHKDSVASYFRTSGTGTIVAGTASVSVANVGTANGLFRGQTIGPGESVTLTATLGGTLTTNSTYDATGTTFAIATITPAP